MSDLTEYFTLQNKIDELEAQVSDLTRALQLSNKMKSKYKSEWRMAIGEHELPTDKARKMIKLVKSTGISSVTSECRAIATKLKLSTGTVRTLWYEKLE